jgi:K+-H+ exchange-related protein
MHVFLVPAGRSRFELYSEAGEELGAPPTREDGRFRRWAHAVNVQWHELVEAARRGRPRGRLARWRDALVCRLAENIAEQRTLWALRARTAATLSYPANVPVERARAELETAMAHARRHHLRWFIIDVVLFVSSVVFFFIPGPNLVAYYFAFRFIGHLQSWRGARQAMDIVQWSFEPDAELAELASLVTVPRAERAAHVAAIAARLNLQRLSSFFDRVTLASADI